MKTEGIEAVFWKRTTGARQQSFFRLWASIWSSSTDHNSGQLRNGPGPYIFIADATRLDPFVEVVTPFEDTHYGTQEMTVRDPDGRIWSLQASVKEQG